MTELKVLALGDVVAKPGRRALQRGLPRLRAELAPDLVVVNGENAAGGSGIDRKTAAEIFAAGADLITLGDHVWRRSEVQQLLNEERKRICRPGNFPGEHSGAGWCALSIANKKVGILNILGRVFSSLLLDCPFAVAQKILETDLKDCDLVMADIHAEATSEKLAFARHFDGRIHLVFGTHTHVPTADLQILPTGTAFVSDLGMCGSTAGVIGMDGGVAIHRFLSGTVTPYKPALGSEKLCGVFAKFSLSTSGVSCDRFERIDREVDL